LDGWLLIGYSLSCEGGCPLTLQYVKWLEASPVPT
jgi:hypothetical protein